MHRILVPLDGSALAEASLPVARTLAGATGAGLLLLHVLEASPPGAVHGQRHLGSVPEARDYLEALARGLASIPVEVQVHEEGIQDAGKSIGEHAEELQSDLVVIATHGIHRFDRIFKGNAAQRALSFGGVPVLTVPAGAGIDAMRWKNLIVTTDGRDGHRPPLAWLGALATSLRLDVELLLVVDTSASLTGDTKAIARSMPASMALALEAAVAESAVWLQGLAASGELEGLSVRTDILRGRPDSALARRQGSRSEDLIVLSTHGRIGFGSIWEGSMAARMLSRLKCAALLVRAE